MSARGGKGITGGGLVAEGFKAENVPVSSPEDGGADFFKDVMKMKTITEDGNNAVIYSRGWLEKELDTLLLTALEVIGAIDNKKPTLSDTFKISPKYASEKIAEMVSRNYIAGIKYSKTSISSKKKMSDEERKKAMNQNARFAAGNVFIGVRLAVSFVIFLDYLSQKNMLLTKRQKLTVSQNHITPAAINFFLIPFLKKALGDSSFVEDFNFLFPFFVEKNPSATVDPFSNIKSDEQLFYRYIFNLSNLGLSVDISRLFPFKPSPYFETLAQEQYDKKGYGESFPERNSEKWKDALMGSLMLHVVEFVKRSTRFLQKIKFFLEELLDLPPNYLVNLMNNDAIENDKIDTAQPILLNFMNNSVHSFISDLLNDKTFTSRFQIKEDGVYEQQMLMSVKPEADYVPSSSSTSGFKPSSSSRESQVINQEDDASSGSNQKKCEPIATTKKMPNVFQNNLDFVENQTNVEEMIRYFMQNFVFWKYGSEENKKKPGFQAYVLAKTAEFSNILLNNLPSIKKNRSIMTIGGVTQLLQISKSLGTNRMDKPYWDNEQNDLWIFGKITTTPHGTDDRFIPCYDINNDTLEGYNQLILLRRLLIAYIFLNHTTPEMKTWRPVDAAYNFLDLTENQRTLSKTIPNITKLLEDRELMDDGTKTSSPKTKPLPQKQKPSSSTSRRVQPAPSSSSSPFLSTQRPPSSSSPTPTHTRSMFPWANS